MHDQKGAKMDRVFQGLSSEKREYWDCWRCLSQPGWRVFGEWESSRRWYVEAEKPGRKKSRVVVRAYPDAPELGRFVVSAWMLSTLPSRFWGDFHFLGEAIGAATGHMRTLDAVEPLS